MHFNVRHIVIGAVLFGTARVGAQTSAPPPAPTFSIGQPSLWQHELSIVSPVNHASTTGPAWLTYDVRHSIVNPVAGVLSAGLAGYTALRADEYGARVIAAVPLLGLSGGVDWNIPGERLAPIFSFETAIRRGGVLGRGTMARVDWLPTRRQTIALGISAPLFRPLAGRTRPRETTVHLADVRPGSGQAQPGALGATDAVRALRASANEIAAFSNVYTPRAERIVAASPTGYSGALRRYDDAVRTLFADAAGNAALGDSAADYARTILFGDVVLPIDSLFGQAKSDARDLSPLARASIRRMVQWTARSLTLDVAHRDAIVRAYAAWLDIVQTTYRDLVRDARDSRLIWLPMELALTP